MKKFFEFIHGLSLLVAPAIATCIFGLRGGIICSIIPYIPTLYAGGRMAYDIARTKCAEDENTMRTIYKIMAIGSFAVLVVFVLVCDIPIACLSDFLYKRCGFVGAIISIIASVIYETVVVRYLLFLALGLAKKTPSDPAGVKDELVDIVDDYVNEDNDN